MAQLLPRAVRLMWGWKFGILLSTGSGRSPSGASQPCTSAATRAPVQGCITCSECKGKVVQTPPVPSMDGKVRSSSHCWGSSRDLLSCTLRISLQRPMSQGLMWLQSPQGQGKCRCGKSFCECKSSQSHSSIPLELPSLPSQLQGAAALRFNLNFSGGFGLKPGHGWSLRWMFPLNDTVIKLSVVHTKLAFLGCVAHPGTQATPGPIPPGIIES